MKRLDELLIDPFSSDISLILSGKIMSSSAHRVITDDIDYKTIDYDILGSAVKYAKMVLGQLGPRAYTTREIYNELMINTDKASQRLQQVLNSLGKSEPTDERFLMYKAHLISIKDLLMDALQNVHRIDLPGYINSDRRFLGIAPKTKVYFPQYNQILGYLIDSVRKHHAVALDNEDSLRFFSAALYLSLNLPESKQTGINIFTHDSILANEFSNLVDSIRTGGTEPAKLGIHDLSRLSTFLYRHPIKVYSLEGDNSSQIVTLYPFKNETPIKAANS